MARKSNKIMDIEKSSVFDTEKIEVKEKYFYYKIYDPSNNIEYYTSYEPKIHEKKIVLRSAFIKETISDNVVDQLIETFYRERISQEFLELDLAEGTIIGVSDEENLQWLNDSKEFAIQKLQELSLDAYKRTIP